MKVCQAGHRWGFVRIGVSPPSGIVPLGACAQLDCLNRLPVCWLWYVVSNGCTAPHCADIVVVVVGVSGSRPSQGGGMYGPAPRVSHTPPRPPVGEECHSCTCLEDVC